MLASKVYSAPMEWGSRDPVKRTGTLGRPEPARASRPSTSARRAMPSLKRLQTDYLDLYQMHHVDRNARWEEIWQAMERADRSRARCSTSARRTSPAGTSPRRRRAPRPAARGGPGLRAERLQPHQAHGRARGAARLRAPTAWRSCPTARWAAGSSAARPADNEQRPAQLHRADRSGRGFPGASATSSASRPAASRWPGWRSQPGVTAPVIGPRTMAQLESSLAALEIALVRGQR